MKCPECGETLDAVGIVGTGATIYHCAECGSKWEIKQVDDDDDEN